jgi:excisionase family DNA binding protein
MSKNFSEVKEQYLSDPLNMTLTEASHYTKLSKSYLYKLVAKKSIPHIRLGYKIIFNKIAIDEWMEKKVVVVNG